MTFVYKDYADGNKSKVLTLEATEFIRRFLLHILPRGFVSIAARLKSRMTNAAPRVKSAAWF